MHHDGRAVCPSCGRLASRLATMEEPAEPEAPAPPPPPAAAPTPPPPPPAPAPRPPAPVAPKPAAPRAAPAAGGAGSPPPKKPRTPADRDAPLPPGIAWPSPEPLPPEEEERAWWKLVVPGAALILVIIVGLVVVFGGGGDGDDDATRTQTTGEVDISDIDEPGEERTTTTETTTTTEAVTTTVARGSDGRVAVDSDDGITWTMAQAPEVEEITDQDGGEVLGQRWVAADGDTTELVEIVEVSSGTFDVDAAIGELAGRFSGSLSAIEDSNFHDGARTASFRGTVDGTPVVGYIVGAQVDDRGLLAMTYREGDDLAGLYGTFVSLPGSVVIA
jgi:hypothetical protein